MRFFHQLLSEHHRWVYLDVFWMIEVPSSRYMITLGNKKLELFDMGVGASEPTADENVKLASEMSNQELINHGNNRMDETDQTIEHSKQVVHGTTEIGTQTTTTLKGQIDQMGRIVNELETIHYSIRKASQLVKEIGRQIVNPNSKDIRDISGLAPPAPARRLLLYLKPSSDLRNYIVIIRAALSVN